MLCRANDDVDDVGKTSTAAAALFHCVVDLRRDDQLPTVLVKELVDRVFDVFVCDEIAATNQHLDCP